MLGWLREAITATWSKATRTSQKNHPRPDDPVTHRALGGHNAGHNAKLQQTQVRAVGESADLIVHRGFSLQLALCNALAGHLLASFTLHC
jgi:hypothetical protein